MRDFFDKFLLIGTTNRAIIKATPVAWAYGQAEATLHDEFGSTQSIEEFHKIKLWIKEYCDGKDQAQRPAIGPDTDWKRYLLRQDWRAPVWLEVAAYGNFNNNPSPWAGLTEQSMLHRLNEEQTETLLNVICRMFWSSVRVALQNEARLESINLATHLGVGTAMGAGPVESTPHRARTKGARPKKIKKLLVLPGAMISGDVTSTTVGETVTVSINGTGGPFTPLKAWKWPDEIMLPPATIAGLSPNDKYVAWDGEQYVFRHTQESVLADKRLMLIGSVKELPVDGDSALTIGKGGAVRTATPPQKGPARGRPLSVAVAKRRELLRKLSATGVNGELYCEAVVNAGLSTPIDWQKRDGCPKSYLEAWNHPNQEQRKRFRQRISDEKYKATK